MTAIVTLKLGAPRSLKTTATLSEVANSPLVFYVVRTNKNVEASIKTIEQYLKSEYKNTMITCNANKCLVCPKFNEELNYTYQELINCKKCEWKKTPITPHTDEILSIGHLSTSELKQMSLDLSLCPKKIVQHRLNRYAKQELPHLYCLTYQMYKNVGKLIEGNIVIFDEARHLENVSNETSSVIVEVSKDELEQELIELGYEADVKKLWNNQLKMMEILISYYIKNLQKEYALNLIKDKKTSKKIGKVLVKYVQYLHTIHRYKKMDLTQIYKEIRKLPNADELTSEQIQILHFFVQKYQEARNTKQEQYLPIRDYMYRTLMQKWKFGIGNKLLSKIEQQIIEGELRLIPLYNFLKILRQVNIDSGEGRRLEVDLGLLQSLNNDKFTLIMYLVWRDISNKKFGVEDRSLIDEAINRCNKVYLIDATPFPQDFKKWWFGKDVPVKKEIYNVEYKMNVVIENRRRNLIQTQFPTEKNNILKIITQLKEQKKLFVFARNKNELNWIKQTGVDCDVSRGRTSEGVQFTGYDLVVSLGLPYENMFAEDYRKADFFVLSKTHFDDEWRELMNVKMRQVLLQQSFRCGRPGVDTNCLWLGCDALELERIKRTWEWCNKINFYVPEQYGKVEDKVKFVLDKI